MGYYSPRWAGEKGGFCAWILFTPLRGFPSLVTVPRVPILEPVSELLGECVAGRWVEWVG